MKLDGGCAQIPTPPIHLAATLAELQANSTVPAFISIPSSLPIFATDGERAVWDAAELQWWRREGVNCVAPML